METHPYYSLANEILTFLCDCVSMATIGFFINKSLFIRTLPLHLISTSILEEPSRVQSR